jgi:addiction module HigA family antidote
MAVEMPPDGWVYKRVTTHPGEMLREEFMIPLGISANRLALQTGMPATRISEIIHERRGVTADTALRLARYFGMSAQFWLGLQSTYELSKMQVERGKQIEREVQPLKRDKAAA